MGNNEPDPSSAVTIRTYPELDRFVQGFVDHFSLLILIGRAGIQKSTIIRQAVGPGVCWLEGNVTPFGMYQQLYRHRDQLVVIDDVDSLYCDRSGVRLLKTLCQSEARKSVAWHSSAAYLEKRGIPNQFTTTSRVAIVANDWKSLNENVLAVEDRGHVVLFDPDAHEVHRQTGKWFDDPEIYHFIGAHLNMIERHSMRLYFRAAELKAAGMDWKGMTLSHFISGPTLLVARLQADSTLTPSQRIARFAALGGGSRSTFYEHLQRLKRAQGGKLRLAFHD